jgi:hypothetical protein
MGLFVSVSNMQRENTTKVTHIADPAALIETAAHSAYFTEVMKVIRDKAKRSSNSAREACRSGIFWDLLPCSLHLGFTLRSRVKE